VVLPDAGVAEGVAGSFAQPVIPDAQIFFQLGGDRWLPGTAAQVGLWRGSTAKELQELALDPQALWELEDAQQLERLHFRGGQRVVVRGAPRLAQVNGMLHSLRVDACGQQVPQLEILGFLANLTVCGNGAPRLHVRAECGSIGLIGAEGTAELALSPGNCPLLSIQGRIPKMEGVTRLSGVDEGTVAHLADAVQLGTGEDVDRLLDILYHIREGKRVRSQHRMIGLRGLGLLAARLRERPQLATGPVLERMLEVRNRFAAPKTRGAPGWSWSLNELPQDLLVETMDSDLELLLFLQARRGRTPLGEHASQSYPLWTLVLIERALRRHGEGTAERMALVAFLRDVLRAGLVADAGDEKILTGEHRKPLVVLLRFVLTYGVELEVMDDGAGAVAQVVVQRSGIESLRWMIGMEERDEDGTDAPTFLQEGYAGVAQLPNRELLRRAPREFLDRVLVACVQDPKTEPKDRAYLLTLLLGGVGGDPRSSGSVGCDEVEE
jgi:hypothetical protein